MDSLIEYLIPLMTLVMVIAVQIAFWYPTTDVNQGDEVSSFLSKFAVEWKKQGQMSEQDHSRTSSKEATRVRNKPVESAATEISFTMTGPKGVVVSAAAAAAIESSSTRRDVSIPGNNNEEVDSFVSNNTWKCACQNGFLPPGMLKTFGSAEAMMRLGTGQCYHKQT
jgi:hypothetical protein